MEIRLSYKIIFLVLFFYGCDLDLNNPNFPPPIENIPEISAEIIDAFDFWLPFVEIRDIEVSDKSADSNSITIDLSFNITKDPNTLDSVQVEIGD